MYIYADSQGQGNTYSLHLTTHIKNVKRVDLVSASVPNVVGAEIQYGSNVITVNSNAYSLPIGHYTPTTLAAAVTAWTPALCEWVPSTQGGRFIFSNISSDFTIGITSPELAKRLGTSGGQSIISTSNLFPMGTRIFAAENDPDFTVSQYQFLDIEEFRNNAFVDSKSITWVDGQQNLSGNTVARVFAAVPMDVEPLSIKTFSEHKDFSHSVIFDKPIDTLSKLTVQWLDEQGVTLNFGGLNKNSFLLRVYTDDERDEWSHESNTQTRIVFWTIGIVLFLVFLLVAF